MTTPPSPISRSVHDLASRYPHWGPAERLELESLTSESDPELQDEALLGMASRLEQSGRLEAAAEIYQAVFGGVRERPHQASRRSPARGFNQGVSGPERTQGSPLQERARSRLDALLGRGSFGARAEFLFRNLTQQAAEPSALFAMGAAGAVFRVTRLATLSRLAVAARPGFLTQLLGAGRVASLAGFALEAPTFSLAARLFSAGLGRHQDWGGRAVVRDLASSYLLLGGLKVAGWGSAAAVRGLAGNGLRGGAFQHLFEQGGMLTGILLGHALEQYAGLRPRQAGATTLVDSLALLFQMNVGGRLSRLALGPRWAGWEATLEAGSARLESSSPAGLGDPLKTFPIPALEAGFPQLVASRTPAGSAAGPAFPQSFAMSSNKAFSGNGGSRSRSLQEVIEEWRETRPAETAEPQGTRRIPLDIQLIGGQAPSADPSEFYREGVLHLLEGHESGFPMRWNGPLGSALRSNGGLRRSLLAAAEAGETRWVAQLHEKRFELSRLVLLENSELGWRPRRVLLGEQIIRYDESQDPAVYDLEFSYGDRPELSGRIFQNNVGETWQADNYWARRASPETEAGLWRWELYPKSSFYLKVEMGTGGTGLVQMTDLYYHRLLQWGAPPPPSSGVRRTK